MTYTKPQMLNVKRASSTIMGAKVAGAFDNINQTNGSTVSAYRSDE